MIKQRIMYVCSECAEGCPEACGHYDRTELRVMPDGAWLCESCFDNNDDNEFLSWGHLPAPEEYRRIPDSAQCAPDQEALQAAWAEGYEFGLNSRDKTPGDIEPLLKDPVAVHINMLRGRIAKPSWAAIKHLYPEHFQSEATQHTEGHSASPVEDCSDQAQNDRLFELDQPYDAETTDGWNPISTAPKDGPAFLVWVPENKCIYEVIARDSNLSIFGGGFRDNLWRATHWMPLPTPPSHPSTQSLRQEG